MSIDPNFKARNDKGAKDFLFPLHRVKGIMKKDP